MSSPPTAFIRFLLPAILLGASLPAAAEEAASNPDGIHVGGAVRFNYFVKSWDEDTRKRLGDIAFDTFRLDLDGQLARVLLSAQYRIYAGYSMLHHGWLGYRFSDATQLQAGVTQVPFGIQPYASHNFFFSIPYYMGFEDDFDLGLKLVHQGGPWNFQVAFFKNSEGHYTGQSTASARYSYDVVPVSAANPTEAYLGVDSANHENNQLNGRVSWTADHGDFGSTEVGLSAQAGQLYNAATKENGWMWAGAAHLNGNYGPFNLKLEAIRYAYDLANPEGEDDRFVMVGAYDAPYKMASRGTLLVAGLSYDVPVQWGPISKLTFYDDFSVLLKSEPGYEDSQQNVLGTMITAGPVYTYVDLAMGKNQPWLGPDYGSALGEGNPSAQWETRFNVNVGYYF